MNLDLDYFDHPKVVRLVSLLGRGADLLPIRLWCYCGKYHAEDGELIGYSPEDVETAIKWWGQPGRAVEALLRPFKAKAGFLESRENGYKVHDWEKINGHIASLRERGQAGALARWSKYKIAQAMPKHSLSNGTANALSPPLPSHPTPPDGGDPPARVGPPLEAREESQADLDRAKRVLDAYPDRAKDGRPVRKDVAAQSVLAARIAKTPDYPFEEHARLERMNPTPFDAWRWAQTVPDAIALEALRRVSGGRKGMVSPLSNAEWSGVEAKIKALAGGKA